jgi:trehalose 6-phosphate phosphatase
MCLTAELDRLSAAYRGGRCLAMLFDFDGTLAPLVTHPDLATCPPAAIDLLSALAALPRVLVGIISSRALADLKTKVSLPGLAYSGSSGLEIELGDRLIVHPKAARFTPVLTAAAEVASLTVRQFPGAWIEHKPFSFAIHYRQVGRNEITLCEQCLASQLARFGGILECESGSLALEVLPAIGWGKGDALDTILSCHGQDAIPLYAGNDARDEGAMLAADKRGGVSIGVGPAAPFAAQCRIADVDGLAEQLTQFLGQLRRS